MTVGVLRKAIEGIDDNQEVCVQTDSDFERKFKATATELCTHEDSGNGLCYSSKMPRKVGNTTWKRSKLERPVFVIWVL